VSEPDQCAGILLMLVESCRAHSNEGAKYRKIGIIIGTKQERPVELFVIAPRANVWR
jgi:hypothetical protein